MTVRLKGTDRYQKTRLAGVAVFAALAVIALVLMVGAVAPWVPTPPPERQAGRAASAVLPTGLPTEAAPPVAAPQAPPGPMLGCRGDQ